jgi:predicted nucleotidyltransferase
VTRGRCYVRIMLEARFPATSGVEVRDRVTRVLADEMQVRWAYLFGSVARGEPFADVDIAIMSDGDALQRPLELGGLAERVRRAVHIDGLNVDVVHLAQMTLPAAAAVLASGIVLVDKDPKARRAWAADTQLRWLDFASLWQMYSDIRQAALRSQ